MLYLSWYVVLPTAFKHESKSSPIPTFILRDQTILEWAHNFTVDRFQVLLPQFAFLHIVVYEECGRMLGHRLLPVAALRPGYRHIVLRNSANQPLGLATLFVKIGVQNFISDDHAGKAALLALVEPKAMYQKNPPCNYHLRT